MRFLGGLIAVVVATLFLSACGDSHDKLMEDQISWMNEMTETVNGVGDGSLSSAEGAAKIKALGKEGGEFVERKKVLNKDVSSEELKDLGDRYRKELGAATKAYFEAMENLAKSGRMTKEFGEAMMNMKRP